MQNLENQIFQVQNDQDFEALSMEIFKLQAKENPVYSAYLRHLKIKPDRLKGLADIPFLPIEFFKTHQIITGNKEPSLVFESSGTSGQISSKHFLVSEEIYQKSFVKNFSTAYGMPENLCILALLPSYLEKGNSSLVYMMNHLIEKSKHPESGFYLNNLQELSELLIKRSNDRHPTILIGVSYALLDLAEQFPFTLPENIIIMETGGMKGRRKELIREDLHSKLKNAFNLARVHSEYGMTELLSQAYTNQSGKFNASKWMKVYARDIYDPFSILPFGQRGGLNVIDLANIYSCCFIATGDLGTVYKNGEFDIFGRLDHSEVRGCNLMVE